MPIKIHRVPLGFTNCYLLEDEGNVLVDTGPPKMGARFMKKMKATYVLPEEIGLIVITHGHYDHIGSAAFVVDASLAPLAMHEKEKDWLEQSLVNLPAGVTAYGRFAIKIGKLLKPLIKFPSAKVDIVLDDREFLLDDYGVKGKVIFTPGHSPGSVSVILDSGDALVGDMAMNAFPLRFSPGLPIFADDLDLLKESWKKVLDMGVHTIHPSHGGSFSADIIREALR